MAFCLAACNSWLDVSPKSQVKNDDLFGNEAGFQTAMFGVYTSMASSTLYGERLTMGFMDVLPRYYTVPSGTSNYYVYTFDYESSTVVSICDQIYLNMYKTIMNCNNLLENMEGKEGLFTKGHYEVMKGEMLGVRAFLHFDLLRMFAPSFAEGKALPAIPYVDKVGRKPFPQLTVEQVAERVIADCKAALEVMKDAEPWVLTGKDKSDDRFYENRRERMNYYAVKALLARVYLYAEKPVEAGKLAGELTGTYGIGTVSTLFSLYSDKIANRSNDLFVYQKDKGAVMTMTDTRRNEIYETVTIATDTRVKTWVQLQTGSTSVYEIAKYAKAVVVPLIQMNEVYYIYAETREQEPDGVAALNKVRNAYNIPAQQNLVAGACVFKDELQKEYRKSFLGEGQFFYFLKRTDAATIPDAAEIRNPRQVYTLPVPVAELEFGNLIEQ